MALFTDNPNLAVALLAAAFGLMGGIVSTLLKGAVDHFVQSRKLRFESDNALQQKIIVEQSDLLDRLGEVSWKFRYSAIKVAWYWRRGKLTEYEAAAKEYQSKCWDSLNDLRFLGTKAGRLFSRSALDDVEKFYANVNSIDDLIEAAITENSTEERTKLLNDVYRRTDKDLREEIAALVLDLAKQVGLTPQKRSFPSYLSGSFSSLPARHATLTAQAKER